MRALRLLLPLSLLLLLAACAPTRPGSSELERQLAEARGLLEQGDHRGAVEIYAKLARQAQQPQRDRLQLLALEAALTPELLDLARQYLAVLDDHYLNDEEKARKRLAQARIALLENRPGDALDALAYPLDGLPAELRQRFAEARAEALSLQGLYLEAATEYLRLAREASDEAARERWRQQLWNTLIQAPALDLYTWLLHSEDPELRGWLELAWIYNGTPIQGGQLEPRLEQWAKRYPGHPASALLARLRAQWAEMQHYPTRIAVLLPLTGKLAPVSQAIVDGLLAAFYEVADKMEQPELRFIDTTGHEDDIGTLYQQAVDDGAGFVIGPLRKPVVQALVTTTTLTVPVLTLNRLDEDINAGDRLYQFGLAPEDEAVQIAERASIEGLEFAISYTPDNSWGRRIERHFRERFEELAGQVLDSGHLAPGSADYSATIMRTLHIDQSRLRYRQVQATIGRPLKFEPRRREDVQFFFVAATPRQARLLKPQLKYHRAGDVPVYASSLVYSGHPDPVADRDLDGVLFCDIPWLFDDTPDAELKARIRQADPATLQRLPRLVALGIDALRIIPYLQRLASNAHERYEGVTGTLWLDADRRLHRRLRWARFEKGRPVPLARTTTATPMEQNDGEGPRPAGTGG